MAKLIYDDTGRLIFTKEMKEEGYTLLAPNMLPTHFKLLKASFKQHGYNVLPLETTGKDIVNEGLKNVHNDTCYPALLVIGQLLNALKSGEYDLSKTGLMITQTGGGCRASNYISLLRKAMKNNGFENIPVVSLNASGMEKNPGFKLTLPLVKKLLFSILYGDLLMLLANQVRPYELKNGSADALVDEWAQKLDEEFKHKENVKYKHMKNNWVLIVKDFAKIPVDKTQEKVKVGVVGEIYVKYSPLGNNDLEKFLQKEGAEVVVPGLLDFLIFKVDNRYEDPKLYGGGKVKRFACKHIIKYLTGWQNDLIAAVKDNSDFRAPAKFGETKHAVKSYLGYGNKMGEGWLLTGEMLELISSGVENIVCAQPFGCLPNHIVGKGMMRKIKENNPSANIVAIDYDPGATAINQENRIKLMLSNAKRAQSEMQAQQNRDFAKV